MRELLSKTVALALAVALVTPVVAQQRGGPRGGRGGIANDTMFLLNKSVQDELKLSDEQKSELKKIQDKRDEAFQKARAAGDRDKSQEIMRTAFKEVQDEANKVKDSLKDEQKKRLRQVQLQTMGMYAFVNLEVQKKLNLSDKQKEEIKSLTEKIQQQERELFEGIDFSNQEKRDAAMKKMRDLQKEARDKAVNILTDEQKKSWKEMTGAPFELKERFGGLPGGRRPRSQQ